MAALTVIASVLRMGPSMSVIINCKSKLESYHIYYTKHAQNKIKSPSKNWAWKFRHSHVGNNTVRGYILKDELIWAYWTYINKVLPYWDAWSNSEAIVHQGDTTRIEIDLIGERGIISRRVGSDGKGFTGFIVSYQHIVGTKVHYSGCRGRKITIYT